MFPALMEFLFGLRPHFFFLKVVLYSFLGSVEGNQDQMVQVETRRKNKQQLCEG